MWNLRHFDRLSLPVMVMSSRCRILLVVRLPRICWITGGTVVMVHCVWMIHLTSRVMRMIVAVPKWRWKVSGRHGRSIWKQRNIFSKRWSNNFYNLYLQRCSLRIHEFYRKTIRQPKSELLLCFNTLIHLIQDSYSDRK